MKLCSKCGVEKPLNEFYKGNNPYCRECTSNYKKALRRADKEVIEGIKELTVEDINKLTDNKSVSVYDLLRHKL